MNQFMRDFESHIKAVDRDRILELLSRIDAGAGSKRWKAVPCGAGVGPNKECWCRMVVTEDCDLEDDKWPDPECIVPAGCLGEADAEFLVLMHNIAPSIVAIRDLMQSTTRCGRCGRPEMKLWWSHEHLKGCMSMTDDEYEMHQLRLENEELRKDNLELRKQLGQIDG